MQGWKKYYFPVSWPIFPQFGMYFYVQKDKISFQIPKFPSKHQYFLRILSPFYYFFPPPFSGPQGVCYEHYVVVFLFLFCFVLFKSPEQIKQEPRIYYVFSAVTILLPDTEFR